MIGYNSLCDGDTLHDPLLRGDRLANCASGRIKIGNTGFKPVIDPDVTPGVCWNSHDIEAFERDECRWNEITRGFPAGNEQIEAVVVLMMYSNSVQGGYLGDTG